MRTAIGFGTAILVVLAGATFLPVAAEEEAAPCCHALLVGCSEYPELARLLGERTYEREVRLFGPANDVALWHDVLTKHLGFRNEDVVILAGGPQDAPKQRPTAANIRHHLAALAERVGPGDRVVVMMAGHGTQVPDDSGDEADGKDEVFLPSDVTKWKPDENGIPGALGDDEIGRAIRRIRDAGATVWLVMDCCHSGTMVRGGDGGLRMRHLAPDLLDVPEGDAVSGVAEEGNRGEPESEGLEGIVAMYGAQSYHRAPEMRLPKYSTTSKAHGLLSFVLASQVRRLGGGVTFGELYRQTVAAYRALPYAGTTPLAEGDLSLTVGGGEGDEVVPLLLGMEIHPDTGERTPSLDAGELAGVVPGTILSVRAPGGGETVLGYVEVEASDLHRSWCRPIPRDDLVLPDLRGDLRVCHAQIVERPLGGYALPFSVVDVQGAPVGLESLPTSDREALADAEAQRKFPFVADPAEADWLVVVTEQGLFLRPAKVGGVRDVGFQVAEGVLAGLARVFRAENLKRLVRSETMPALEEGMVVEISKVTETGDVPLGDDVVLRPGDRVKLVVHNTTHKLYDLWVFFLDADHGLHVVFPSRSGYTPRLTFEDTKPWEREIPIVDTTIGLEHVLVVAIPQEEGAPPTNLRWLAQKPLQRVHGGIRHRGAAEGGGFGEFLDELAFGAGLGAGRIRTRGFGSLEGEVAPAMKLIDMRTEWAPVVQPAPFEEPTVCVLEARHVSTPRRPAPRRRWDPVVDATRFRGDLAGLYAHLAPAVVVVRTRTGHGTGFVIDEDGHVLTNDHVVSGGFTYTKSGRPQVHLHRGVLGGDGIMALERKALPAEVVMTDETRDLALLRITGDRAWLKDVRPVRLAERSLRPGERCVMVGHPASALLWSVRQCHVSGVGRSPHDFSDVLLRSLSVPEHQRDHVLSRLEHIPPVRILLSSCQANPGDSGGPLVNEEGELVAVTHAIPAEVRTDKFVYHIHLDEVRDFLAGRPDPKAKPTPLVPKPWRLGPNVQLRKTAYAGRGFDLLLAGVERPEQILVDIDGDTEPISSDAESITRLVASKGFDAEVAFHLFSDRRVAFYDGDNDGDFDLVLVDQDEDPEADVRFARDGDRWIVETGVNLPWLSTTYMRWIEDLPPKTRDEQRMAAIGKLKLLTSGDT